MSSSMAPNQSAADVERLAALDPLELDRPQLVAALLVVADHPGLAAQRAVHREFGHRPDQLQVPLVRRRRAGEVARLLHHHLLRPDPLGELAGEPFAGVDLVDLDVAERVAGTSSPERSSSATMVSTPAPSEMNRLTEPTRSITSVSRAASAERSKHRLGDVDAVHVPRLPAEPELRQPLPGVQPLPVRLGRRGGQPAAVPAHHLVHDQHPRARVVLADDVLGEPGALLGRGPGAEGLSDRDDVVVDGLGQTRPRSVRSRAWPGTPPGRPPWCWCRHRRWCAARPPRPRSAGPRPPAAGPRLRPPGLA